MEADQGNKIKLAQRDQDSVGVMMGHETRLGYIEGRLESFATKADIKDLEGKMAVSDQRILTHVSEAIGKQTKWILVSIIVPFFVAIIGWSILFLSLIHI